MSKLHILTVLTPDRPRIIATITQTVAGQKVRVIEMSQTVVRNYFTVTAVLALPTDGDPDALAQAVRQKLDSDASVTMVELHQSEPAVPVSEVYVLTLMGGDTDAHALLSISETLANAGGNIIDFSAQSNTDGMQIIAEVQLPADCPVDQLQIDLQHALGGEDLLHVRLQHQRLFQATNEIAFRRIDHL